MDTARILIVDDDAILATRLEEMLLQLGYQPTGLAATGEAAVEMALAQKPDAILMDIRLRGEMTGIQAAEEIHQQTDIPIIYLTAYTEEDFVQQARITDAYAYLAKPVRDRELRASLEMALYKHATEKRLQHLNQVLSAVRDINQLITREKSTQRLLEEACRILVRTRGYRLVWIGKTKPEHRLVYPVASAGEHTGYLDQVEITWDDSQTGQGPTGVAIREKRPVVCHDLAVDPSFLPWREAAIQHGFVSSAAFPILHEQSVLCVLSVYGDRADLFGDEEVELLDEVTSDLAFALIALEEEAARKRAEAENQRLASFPQLNPNPVLEVNREGMITYINQAAISLLERAQLAGQDVLLPNDMHSILGKLTQGESALLYREVNVGERILGEDIHLLPEFDVMRIYARDITDRKQVEHERLESELKFRNVFDHSAVAKSLTSLDGKVNVNQAFCDMLGYSPAEMSQVNWQDISHPDDLELTQKYLAQLISGEKISARFVKRYLKKDGSIVWGDLNTVLQRDQDGTPQYYITTVMDITERKRAEAELREQHDQLIKFSSQVPGMLYRFRMRPDGTFCVPYTSVAIQDIFGCSPDEVREDFSPIASVIVPDDLPEVIRSIENSAKNLTPWQCEYRVQIPGQPVRWVWGRSMPEKQPDGGVIWYGFNTDITERKLDQFALLESEKRYRELFVQMLAAFALHEIICDENNRPVDYRFLDFNPAFERMTGLKRADTIGKTVLEVFPQIEPVWIERYGRVALTGEPCHFEQYFPPLDKYFEVSAFSPKQGQFAVTFTDVSESRLALERQRLAEESYRAVFDNAPVGIFQSTPEGRYVNANQALADIYGYASPEEMMAEVTDITNQLYWDPAERQDFQRQLLEYGEVHGDEVRNRRKDGSLIWITRSARTVKNAAGEILYYEGFLQDISQRKRADEALQNSEQQYRTTLDSMEAAIHLVDEDLQIVLINQAFEDWNNSLGLNTGVVGQNLFSVFPFLPDKVRQEYRQVFHSGEILLTEDTSRVGEKEVTTTTRKIPIFENGKVVRVVSVVEDITERKLAEKALQESEARYRNIFEGVQDAIFVESPSGRILDVNQRACEMFGYSREEFLTKAVTGLVPLGSAVICADNDQDESLPANPVETRNMRANGEVFPVELSCRLQEISGEQALLVVLRDITERKRAEETLHAALRDKEVLLRELYHRTKNNMQVISALLNMEADRSADAVLQKTLRDMDTRILSMALVHEKLYQSKNLARIDLKDYIVNLAAMILESYDVKPDKVRLSINAESITVPIESAIPCGLLVNEIISNSLKHAFPGERTGEITIRLTRLDQGNVLLEISDNGIGIPAEIDLNNLKSLGMRIIFGIAGHQLHAQVQVNTSSGVGWRIHFPNLTGSLDNEAIQL